MRRILTLLSFLPLFAQAQTPLPYTTGFDNTAQQAGWQGHRTGHLNNYAWTITGSGGPSAPNRLWHDYPVGGADTDTVQDWYVSPAFNFSAGASLTLKINVYSIMGSTTPSDAIKVMLLNGSPDPETATVSELADLSALVTSSATFTQVPPIAVPPTPGPCYIAFYYQATTNWFTPGIDDVAITSAATGIHELSAPQVSLAITDHANAMLEVRGSAVTGGAWQLQLYDVRGARVLERTLRDRTALGSALPAGTYLYALADADGRAVARGRLCLVR